MPQPIAANLNGASTILAEAFPASFITFDPLVFYRLDYFKKAECLICKVMLDLRSGATAGSGFSIAETIGEDRHDVSALSEQMVDNAVLKTSEDGGEPYWGREYVEVV